MSEFSKQTRNKSGLQSHCKVCNKAYRIEHAEKIDVYNNQYYKDNKEILLANQKIKDSFRKEEIAAYKAAHYKNNKEKIKVYRKAYRNTYEGKGKINANVSKRLANKLQQTPKWLTKEQHKEIEQWYVDTAECRWLSLEPLHVDHIIPLQGKNVSGLHVPWNMQILPASENIRKSNRT